MEDKKSELLQYAREYAAADKDLYELLSVSADAAQPEVHRAWRKASLKHHPDKAKNFDPEIWQLFERARDVLSLPDARAAYDSARAAALQAQKARAALDAKRRAMIDDLEARERGVKRKADDDKNGRHMMTEAEKRVLMEKGREHLENRRRMREEAEAKERERDRARGQEEKKKEEQTRTADSKPIPPDFNLNKPGAATSADDTPMEDAQPGPPEPKDEYDDQIAILERRILESNRKREAKKEEKKRIKRLKREGMEGMEKSKTNGHQDDNNNNDNDHNTRKEDDGPPTSVPTATTRTRTAESSFSSSTLPEQSTPNPNTTTPDSNSTRPLTMMEKLRAAQREKERKKAEAEAAAAAVV